MVYGMPFPVGYNGDGGGGGGGRGRGPGGGRRRRDSTTNNASSTNCLLLLRSTGYGTPWGEDVDTQNGNIHSYQPARGLGQTARYATLVSSVSQFWGCFCIELQCQQNCHSLPKVPQTNV